MELLRKFKRWFRLRIPARYYPEDLYMYWPTVCPECGYKCLSSECMGGMPNLNGEYDPIICPECFSVVNKDTNIIIVE